MSNEINKKQQEIKEKMQQQKYQSKVDNVTPKPPLLKNICWAFVVGGLICTLGQLITDYFLGLSLQKKRLLPVRQLY